jgi:predicted dehydrogenase
MPLIADPSNIRLGIAGKVDENDHPYSWSAILNGYEPKAMREFAHPMISKYLAAQSADQFGIAGVRVTHIWCDNEEESRRVAAASQIAHVVSDAKELIGHVDAVLIPTDRGEEHVERARPFVEAGVPVFMDKPLCDNETDLATFRQWIAQGRPILSCSAMRFAVEFEHLRARLTEIGRLRLITITMAKSWARYGIHALEAIYPFFEPGKWKSVINTGRAGACIAHLEHGSGVDAMVVVMDDLFGGFGVVHAYGTAGHLVAQFADSFSAFKRQLAAFVDYLCSGISPWPFSETDELICLLIAGDKSLQLGHRVVLNP